MEEVKWGVRREMEWGEIKERVEGEGIKRDGVGENKRGVKGEGIKREMEWERE